MGPTTQESDLEIRAIREKSTRWVLEVPLSGAGRVRSLNEKFIKHKCTNVPNTKTLFFRVFTRYCSSSSSFI